MQSTDKKNIILEINKLHKVFDEDSNNPLEAVKEVSLNITQNELTVLLGPSGCGKSTVLRMIAGLETPSSGKIFDGTEEINSPSRKRGMVFQSYTSFEWLTVSKNIELTYS